jgi:hypothetical protein
MQADMFVFRKALKVYTLLEGYIRLGVTGDG